MWNNSPFWSFELIKFKRSYQVNFNMKNNLCLLYTCQIRIVLVSARKKLSRTHVVYISHSFRHELFLFPTQIQYLLELLLCCSGVARKKNGSSVRLVLHSVQELQKSNSSMVLCRIFRNLFFNNVTGYGGLRQ